MFRDLFGANCSPSRVTNVCLSHPTFSMETREFQVKTFNPLYVLNKFLSSDTLLNISKSFYISIPLVRSFIVKISATLSCLFTFFFVKFVDGEIVIEFAMKWSQ